MGLLLIFVLGCLGIALFRPRALLFGDTVFMCELSGVAIFFSSSFSDTLCSHLTSMLACSLLCSFPVQSGSLRIVAGIVECTRSSLSDPEALFRPRRSRHALRQTLAP